MRIIKSEDQTDITQQLLNAIIKNPNKELNDLAWQSLKEIVVSLQDEIPLLPVAFAVNRNLTFEVAIIMSIFYRLMQTVESNDSIQIQLPTNEPEEKMNGANKDSNNSSKNSHIPISNTEGSSTSVSNTSQ